MTAGPEPDEAARAQALQRLDSLTKPPGSLGRLEELAAWSAAVQGRCPPEPFDDVRLVIVAGDHGVAARTSSYPASVTAQMVANFTAGGAAATVLADRQQVAVRVVDAGVDHDHDGSVSPSVYADRIRRGSGAIDREDALTSTEAEQSIATGRRVADHEIDEGADLLIVGDMGIGNTTPAAALIAALTGADVFEVTGRGTGIDDSAWMRKATAIRDALWRVREVRGPAPDPVELIARLGGADFGVMAGALAQAADRRTPVLLDGVVVTAAALVARLLAPHGSAWWLAGHRSAEPAHGVALATLGLEPVLTLGMRLGEGSGALVALPVVQAAIALLGGMATFESAGVSTATARPSDGPDEVP